MKIFYLLTLGLLVAPLANANDTDPMQSSEVSSTASAAPANPVAQPPVSPATLAWHDGDLPYAPIDIKKNTFLIFDASVPDQEAKAIRERLEAKQWKLATDKDSAARSMTIFATFRAYNDDSGNARDTLELPLKQVLDGMPVKPRRVASTPGGGQWANYDAGVSQGLTGIATSNGVGGNAAVAVGIGAAMLVQGIVNSVIHHKSSSDTGSCVGDCFHRYHNQVAYHLEFRENRKDFNETFDVVRFNVTAEQRTESGMTKLPDGVFGILTPATDELIKSL
jgi:hypothetical protein